ncbi:universal stress protein [Blastococcus sp. TF02A-30]|uniref:universal stress protein n=1 Tax=Blastococcus sp. TF02A-30 TaxID=2250580 RepID=UPI000DE87496|nr:universal stress protein [Blastococcus sp. TF02A-30]
MTTTAPLDPGRGADRAEPGPAADDRPVREVVVGVDGSECALAAVRWAAEEALRRGAPLRIVHAAPYLTRHRVGGAVPHELHRARQITGRAYTVARRADRELQVSTEIVPGDPTTALLRAAAAGQLLVLGSSTTGVLDEWVIAPVTSRVAARAPQPVVVVPRSHQPATGPLTAVLGIGDPGDDEAVAAFAAASARRSGATLRVVQTRPQPLTWADDEEEWGRRNPGLAVEHVTVPGATGRQLLSAVCPTPLVVVSAGHLGLLHRGLDGPHRWLLRHCTSPLAMVPPVHRPELDPREEIVAVG